ncbi:Protein ANTAGONIST OF LIKE HETEROCHROMATIN PROTEIN 1 [Chionoecetes opilio]|uniref:Protein ANTAGONIST OF LIKE HETEROCHROMATIN PROTEIN 1 n=1 Tax=Chionoecetes opilio TaxID=41210 RepID=A0A8J4Y8Y6_CHIOP|nr:Protein ANTAGONIST OF LIKE HETEROCHROMATIN PROTEIN 1 [Chionoecetes opilio]
MNNIAEFILEEFNFVNSLIKPENRHNTRLMKWIFSYIEILELLAIANFIHQEEQEKKERSKRTVWVWPSLQRRLEHGHYENLMEELARECPQLYKNFTRVDKQLFDEIVERVTPIIQRKPTFWRKPIPPGLRVAITLRFLATGETYKSLQYSFRVAHNTISQIVPDTCQALISVYGDQELKTPQSPAEWKEVASGFEERWNLPHCVGAINGKHIRIRNPSFGGTYYFNYKKFFSIVLLAIVHSNYKFIYVDVRAIGSESDGGGFAHTRLSKLLDRQTAKLPPAEPNPAQPAPTTPPPSARCPPCTPVTQEKREEGPERLPSHPTPAPLRLPLTSAPPHRLPLRRLPPLRRHPESSPHRLPLEPAPPTLLTRKNWDQPAGENGEVVEGREGNETTRRTKGPPPPRRGRAAPATKNRETGPEKAPTLSAEETEVAGEMGEFEVLSTEKVRPNRLGGLDVARIRGYSIGGPPGVRPGLCGAAREVSTPPEDGTDGNPHRFPKPMRREHQAWSGPMRKPTEILGFPRGPKPPTPARHPPATTVMYQGTRQPPPQPTHPAQAAAFGYLQPGGSIAVIARPAISKNPLGHSRHLSLHTDTFAVFRPFPWAQFWETPASAWTAPFGSPAYITPYARAILDPDQTLETPRSHQQPQRNHPWLSL